MECVALYSPITTYIYPIARTLPLKACWYVDKSKLSPKLKLKNIEKTYLN